MTSRSTASYELVFRKSVAVDLRGVPTHDLRKILAAIESLSKQPRPTGSERPSGQDRFRLRQGDYRIVCEVLADVRQVVVVKVAHRRDVYRRY
jgi:mRNA interferase RelE/StbE